MLFRDKCEVRPLIHQYGWNPVKEADCLPFELLHSILGQIENGNTSICGYMLESNLEYGSQPITADKSKLRYGVSVTDACIGWAETEELIMETYTRLKNYSQPY